MGYTKASIRISINSLRAGPTHIQYIGVFSLSHWGPVTHIHLYQWNGSSEGVQVMTCPLVGTKPLPKPMWIGPLKTNFSENLSKIWFSLKETAFKYFVCQLFRAQCDKWECHASCEIIQGSMSRSQSETQDPVQRHIPWPPTKDVSRRQTVHTLISSSPSSTHGLSQEATRHLATLVIHVQTNPAKWPGSGLTHWPLGYLNGILCKNWRLF